MPLPWTLTVTVKRSQRNLLLLRLSWWPRNAGLEKYELLISSSSVGCVVSLVLQSCWRKLECHDRCVNALNCHQRFLSDLAARVADDEARERDPAGYKQLVLPLVPVQENGRRCPAIMEAHKLGLVEFFEQDEEARSTFLLTKPRFISKMVADDGYEQSDASDSFERRLAHSNSEHLDSEDDEPRVRYRGNKQFTKSRVRKVNRGHHDPSSRRRGHRNRVVPQRSRSRNRCDRSSRVTRGRSRERAADHVRGSGSDRRASGSVVVRVPSETGSPGPIPKTSTVTPARGRGS